MIDVQQCGDRRFLPITRSDLLVVLASEGILTGDDQENFRTLSGLIAHVFHFVFNQERRVLKHNYFPFDPDTINRTIHEKSAEDRAACAEQLTEQFERILRRANYHRVQEDELNELLSAATPWGLKLSVDVTQFKHFCLYFRGEGEELRTHRGWQTWFRKSTVSVPVFRRLVLLVQFRDDIEHRGAEGSRFVYLKLFKNIPRTDLEMLFPNTVAEMKLIDKLRVLMPLIGGAGTTLFKILAAAVINLFAALFFGALFLGYAIKSFFGYLRVKEKYQGTLLTNLYFNSLDNNLGVIHHIIDQAEEEECKEALLAYYFLLTHPEARRSEEKLDQHIEAFLADRFGIHMDFDAPDSLDKLKQLGLLRSDASGALSVPPLESSLAILDETWDTYFDHREPW